MKGKIGIFLACFSLVLGAPFCANAKGILDLIHIGNVPVPTSEISEVPQIKGETVTDKVFQIFLAVVQLFLFIAGIGATAMIVIAGIRMTFSTGSEEQIEGAKKMLLYAVLGLLAVFLSFLVVQNVAGLFYPGQIVS